ncbi:MAG TPA: hypothetical protein ENI99_00465 [Sedimenticola sp.]|nr:hypothetical protein [Sedimenticola sp.]
MKNRSMSVLSSILVIGLAVVAANAVAATVELQFDSLPTDQGWHYQGHIPESTAASVDGTKLIINTMNRGAVTAWFFMPNIVNPDLPFTLSVRARVSESETLFWPFGFQARNGLELWSVDLGQDSINLPSQATMPIVGAQFHDFVIDVIPGVKSDFYIDGILAESTTPFISNVNGYSVSFGDGNAVNSNSNGLIEISRLSFVQPVPLPGALPLLISGIIGLSLFSNRRVRQNRRC